jgi:kynurenine formamidase
MGTFIDQLICLTELLPIVKNIINCSPKLLVMNYCLVLSLILLASCAGKEKNSSSFETAQWIDLSYSYDSTTLYWPNNERGFEHSTEMEGFSEAGFYYSSYSVFTPEHGGTHLDAPIHFSENKLTTDQIPLSSLTGSAVVIDVSGKALADPDYLISVADIEAWEKMHGKLEDNIMIFFRTGYGAYYPDREKYFGTALKGADAIPLLHFPGIGADAAEWLVKNRKIKAVGIDTPSLDHGQSKDFMSHRVLLGENIPGFENLANLDKLPVKGIFIVALPMKIAKGSGAPLRIIATIVE